MCLYISRIRNWLHRATSLDLISKYMASTQSLYSGTWPFTVTSDVHNSSRYANGNSWFTLFWLYIKKVSLYLFPWPLFYLWWSNVSANKRSRCACNVWDLVQPQIKKAGPGCIFWVTLSSSVRCVLMQLQRIDAILKLFSAFVSICCC